jgi:hypothetical protein
MRRARLSPALLLLALTLGRAGAAEVAGGWLVTDVVETTSYAPFQGLRIAYRIELDQEGAWLFGRGEKWAVNGVPLPRAQRTPIALAGSVTGRDVVVRYVELGTRRESEGTFSWQLSPDGGRLVGRFTGTAAAARGPSTAVRR